MASALDCFLQGIVLAQEAGADGDGRGFGGNFFWIMLLGLSLIFGLFLLIAAIAFAAYGKLWFQAYMSNADVSFVWPLTSLTFVFSTLAARFYLHEQIDALRWTGVLLIVLGAGLITYTEKKKERIQKGSMVMRSAEYPRL